MEDSKILFLNWDRPTKEGEYYKKLIESGEYKEILVPPNVNLKERPSSDLLKYYYMKLQETYQGTIVIFDHEKVFIHADN